MVPVKRFVVASVVVGSVFLRFGAAPAWAGLCAQCGGNAATVGDGIVFDELRLDGPGKAKGPTVTGVVHVPPGQPPVAPPGKPTPGTPVSLEVTGGNVSAFTKDAAHESVQLEGTIISLKMKDGRSYEAWLESKFDTMLFWAIPQDPVPAYVFKVRKVTERKNGHPARGDKSSKYAAELPPEIDFTRPLCTGQFREPVPNDKEGQPFTALMFQGDHYNDDHTVSKQAKGTFNLACFGTASAKMHLLRHTTASITPTSKLATSLEQRTAMLRAITADYCGDGRSWTADGTPLWWTDQGQSFPLSNQPNFRTASPLSFKDNIEAVWGINGKLLCLSEPRRAPRAAVVDQMCQAPAVPRTTVTDSPVACRGGKKIPSCNEFPWSNKGKNPFSEPPLLAGTAAATMNMPGAYVVTVHAPRVANYCNRTPSRLISWP